MRGALHRELEPQLAAPAERVEGCAALRRESYYAAVAARHAASLDRARPVRALDESA
jgi:RNA polymerase sigma factor for flagellar operon FliA